MNMKMSSVVPVFLLLTLFPDAGFAQITRDDKPFGCPGREHLEDEEDPILLPFFPPPPPGTVFFDVILPDVVPVGSRFAVLTITSTRPRTPVAGVWLTLRNIDLQIVDTTLTGLDGVGFLFVPAFPGNDPRHFFIEATRAGAANYIPREDDRAIELFNCTTGYYPTNYVSAWPDFSADRLSADPIQWPVAAVRPPGTTRKFEIDQALGWTQAIPGFSGIIKKASNKGFDADDDWWARRSDIREHLTEKNRQDIYVFYGHASKNSVWGWSKFMWIRGGRNLSIDAMVDSVKADRNPPGIVFLAGCETSGMLQPLVDASVKLALGFTDKAAPPAAGGALIAFWEKFLGGSTLNEALRAGQRIERSLVFRGKEWVRGTMTLEDILTHE